MDLPSLFKEPHALPAVPEVAARLIATFEDDKGAYDQKDAGGFIKLNALRMRIAANLHNRKK